MNNDQVAVLNWNETENHESRAVLLVTHVARSLWVMVERGLIKNISLEKQTSKQTKRNE